MNEPLDPVADTPWVRSLPKVELHCHLGGFATSGELLSRVRSAARNPSELKPDPQRAPPEGWPRPASSISLDDYMRLGDANGSSILFDRGCLEAQVTLLYQHLMEERVCYAEIRCSPNNYCKGGRDSSAWDILTHIRNVFQRCMDEAPADPFRCHVNLIVIATRRDGGDRSDISRHLALAITAAQHWREGCRVVGVDLAGFEHRETRAALFQTDFEAAHRVGLAVTCHAGENDDAEGIWQAVFKLNARRIGHALHLTQSPDLLRTVAERGIGIEMCPFANYQIAGFHPMRDKRRYPLQEYLQKGVMVCVNTDNIGISSASLSENILFLAELCPELTRRDVLQLQANAASLAFTHAEDRARIRALIDSCTPLP